MLFKKIVPLGIKIKILEEMRKVKSNSITTFDLENFLGTKIPDMVRSFITVEFLENSHVKTLLPEREPQFYINRAVFGSIDSVKVIIATTHITPQMCQGHFDWAPILPLAILAQCAGQVGALLVNLVTDNKTRIPLAVHVKETKSISDKTRVPRKDFVIPGDNVVFVATYEGGKFNFHKATVEMYIEGTIIGKLEEIGYVLVEKEYLLNNLKGGDF